MISTEQFLKRLEEREILSAKLVESLRAQVAGSEKPITAKTIAKKLVKAKKLDPQVAKELLRELEDELASNTDDTAEGDTGAGDNAADDDFMELAPIDDAEGKKAKKAESRRRERAAETKPQSKPKPPVEVAEEEDDDDAIDIGDGPESLGPPKKQAPPQAPPIAENGAKAKNGARAKKGSKKKNGEAAENGPAQNGADSLEAAAAETETQRNLDPRGKKRGIARMLRIGRRKGPRRRKQRAPGTSVWDTKLMLIGGGALLAILIVGGVLYWALSRESGDKMIELANQDYADGSYSQAINKYDQFLTRYSGHAKTSFARVRKGLARMWQADGVGNWPRALQTAQEVLPEIRQEEAFKEARDELRSLLPRLTEGLAKDAQELAVAEKPEAKERVDQTRVSIEIIEKHLPKSQRPTARIEEVNAMLAIARRQIKKDAELTKAVDDIRARIKEQKLSEAYAVRHALLKEYPDLSGHERLTKVVLEIAEAEQAAVAWKAESRKPVEPPAPVPTVSFAGRTFRSEPAGAKNKTVFAHVEGALYGLDAADGKVLWRRWVGINPNPRSVPFQPVSLTGKPGGDCLMYDAASDSLLRIAAQTGDVVWLQQLGLDVDAPATVAGNDIYIASREGKLVRVGAESGVAEGFFQMPQALGVPPTVVPAAGRLYQVADHSNLYVIDLKDNKCKDVFHLGHSKGGISTPPVVVSRYLILADNDGARHASLKVFEMTPGAKEGEIKPLQSIKLSGHVDRRPIVDGAKILATTDVGATYVFQIIGDNKKEPLQASASAEGSGSETFTRYCLLRGSGLWVGDAALTCFDIQSSRGELKWKWTSCENSVFTQPLVAVGDTVYTVRRRRGIPGEVVAAVSMSKPNVLWETTLGVASVGNPDVGKDGKRLEIATAAGDLFEVPVDRVGKTAVVDETLGSLETTQLKKAISSVRRFPDGTIVLSFGSGSNQLAVFDPAETPKRFRMRDLPGTLACEPVAFRDGLIVPTREGQVVLVNPRTGDKLVEPFQPEIAAGTRPNWRTPAALDGDAFLLSDGATMLYRVTVADQPKPHLIAENKTAVGRPIERPPASVGKFAVAVDNAGTLIVFALPVLKTAVEEPMGGRCVFGPVRVGGAVLAQSSTGELFRVGDDGKIQRWKKPFEGDTPVDAALIGGDPWIALMQGGVVRLDGTSGEVKSRIDVKRPLQGIFSAGDKPILLGRDGSLVSLKETP